MAERATLVTELRVDDQLTGKLGAAKAQLTQLDATARKAGSSVGGLGSSLGGIAKAGATAFVAFKALDLASDFFASGIKGAIQEEAGIARLTAALKANVPAWDQDTAAIERTIKAREALGFADDEQRDALALAVVATKDAAQAQSILATAMDLARLKGKSLAEATEALIKIEGGQFRALKALGIELRDGATQTEALAAVQAVAAGQAVAFGAKTAGAMAAAGVAIDNLKEDIGAGLLPVLGEGARLITGTVIPTLGLAAKGIENLADEALRAIPIVDAFFNATSGGSKTAGASLLDFLPLGGQLKLAYGEIDKAAIAAAEAQAQQTSEIDRARQAHINHIIATRDLDAAVRELGVDLLLAGNAADDAGANLRHFAGDARGLTQDINDATTALSHFNDEAGKVPSQTGVDEPGQNFIDGGGDPHRNPTAATALVIRTADFAADSRLAKAKARAREEADAYEKALGKAFDNAKRTANSLFDTLHSRHVQAIRDAETLAEKQHSGALQLISDTLKAQLAVNAGPVSAAQAALNERQQAQGRRGLVESLSAAQVAAQSNTDPEAAADLARALRDATEALQNFDDAAKIARLTTVQGTEDAKAQQAADAATLKADAALTAAKAQAQKDLDAETIAAQKRKKDFENALAKLEAADLKAKKSPAEQKADIAKLEERFGITTDPVTGFHHITDPLVTAIKNIAPPIVNVTFNPVFNAVFQVGARAVAAALASQSSPTSTPMVRTGAAGRS